MSTTAPLEGIRVADFTWVWAGPYCTLQLAHLGAEVIRVETATRICVTRLLPPWADGEFGFNRSGYFNQYNQGKRSLALDLKQPHAIDIAKELIAKCDIVCENFAAGVMDRMGLGYEVLRQIKSDIIMIALSGYGATGPESHYVSYGPAQVPLSGLSSVTGYRDWPPMHVGISYGDPNGGLHGAVAVLAALHHRARTGRGQYIDLSQQETTIAVLAEAVMEYTMNGAQPPRDGNRVPQMAPHGVFRCRGDERWVAIAVRHDDDWRRFADLTGLPALATDARFATLAARKQNEDALEAIVGTWTETRGPEEATRELQTAGIPAFTSMSNRDLSEDPHLNEAGFFVSLPHPEVGIRQHAGIPWRLSRTPTAVRRAAPCLGQDTDYVMGEILGYSADAIQRLKEENVLN
ncbi:MAG: CoA transferase [Deltaproteobacteria bacterium]|nr:CoA transferase [Deltaproteobacteria bacterium]MBI3389044.1 CoA transferase [Deltaproteobacteria bacterium]